MGHSIQAFIGRTDALTGSLRGVPHALLLTLRQGFAAVPVTDELYDETMMNDLPHAGEEPVLRSLSIVTTSFGLKLSQRAGTVAYVETDYFGGQGFQLGVAWDSGRVIVPAEQSQSRPINRALAAIGVKADMGDEFDSISLGHYRDVEAMVRDASAP